MWLNIHCTLDDLDIPCQVDQLRQTAERTDHDIRPLKTRYSATRRIYDDH